MTTGDPWKTVCLRIWYEGFFKKIDSKIVYMGRTNRTLWIDKDEFCWFTLLEEAEKCRNFTRNVDAIYFLNPTCGFQRVVDDINAKIMCEIATVDRIVECYLVLEGDVPRLMQLIDNSEKNIIHKVPKLTPRRNTQVKKQEKCTSKTEGPPQSSSPSESLKESTIISPHKTTFPPPTSEFYVDPNITTQNRPFEILPKSSKTVPSKIVDDYPTSYYDFNDITLPNFFDAYEENAALTDKENTNLGEVSDDDDDSGYVPDQEEEVLDDEEEVLDDEKDLNEEEEEFDEDGELNELVHSLTNDELSDDEEAKQAREKLREWNANALKVVQQLQIEASSRMLGGQEIEVVTRTTDCSSEFQSDYDESGDEIHTPGESEEESRPGKRRRSIFSVITERSDFSKLKWCVGIRFPNREVFKNCVTRYAIAQGRNLTFDVSDKGRGKRLRVRCVAGCPFKLYGSWDNKMACFLVKSVEPDHTCNKTMESNRQLKSTWLAKQFLEVFKARPHWPASEIIETVIRAYKVIIQKGFAYKVKYYAHMFLHGSMKDHYSKMGSYITALEKASPNSSFTLVTLPNPRSSVPIFHRFFVCFEALKKRWLSGCRKILCVDACFLKTFLGGQLISAVGRDVNEQMFPLAWAVVEGENNESYEWFFQELKKSMGEEDDSGWTFISDQHQSILTTIAREFPKAEHRYCARHIYLQTGTSLINVMK